MFYIFFPNIFGLIAFPTFSELGWHVETMGVCGALLVGELIGYTLEAYWRSVRLDLLKHNFALRSR